MNNAQPRQIWLCADDYAISPAVSAAIRELIARLQAEIASQLAAFRTAFGRAPDYVDGHQHIHVFPQIREAALRVIKQSAPQAWLRQCGRPKTARKSLADPKGYILDVLSGRLRALAAKYGVRTNPAFAGTYAFRPEADFAKLFVGFLDGREREYAFLLGERFPRLLAERGYALAHP